MGIFTKARELYEKKVKPTIGLVKAVSTVAKQLPAVKSVSKLYNQSKPSGGVKDVVKTKYFQNRYAEPVKNIPSNVKALVSKKSTKGEKAIAGLGLAGGIATLFPDPVGDIAFPIYDFAKGYDYSRIRGGNLRQNLKSGKEAMTLEKPRGLGESQTVNKTAGEIGNLLELPAVLLTTGKLNKNSQKALIKELDKLTALKESGKITSKQLDRLSAIKGLVYKTKTVPEKVSGETKAVQQDLGVTPFEYSYKKGYSAEPDSKTLDRIRTKEQLNIEKESKALTQKTKKYNVSDVTKIIKEATNKGIDVPIAAPYKTNIVKGALNRGLLAVEDFFNRQGSAGKAFTKMYRSARYDGEVMAGKATVALEKALKKLSKEEMDMFADVAEGKAVANTPNLKTAVDVWDSIRKDIANKAQESGLRIKSVNGTSTDFVPRENYFPHFVPENIINDAKARKDALVKLVQSGWADNVAQAEYKLNAYITSKVKRRYGNLEKSRGIDYPMYEKDPTKVLFNYIDSAYHRVSDAKYFGPGDERAYRLADEIALKGGDGELARRALDRVFGKEDFSQFSKDVSSTLTGLQTVTKLGVGAVTNVGQSISTAAYTNLPTAIKSAVYSLFKNKEEAKYFTKATGEILDSSKREFAESFGGNERLASKFLKFVKFTASEEFNRIVAGNAGRFEIRNLAKSLLKNPNDSQVIRAIKKFGVDPQDIIKEGGVSLDTEIKAAKNVIENTQFKTQPYDLPYSWSSPVGKILTQFKSFSYKQSKFIIKLTKNIFSEAKQGNFKPLLNAAVTFGIAAPLVGEVLGDIKAFLKNKSRKDEKPVERYLNNLFFTASLGLLEDVGTLMTGKYGASGNIGVVAGPTASDAYKLLEAGQSLLKDRKTMTGMKEVKSRITPLARFAVKQIPVVGPAIESALIPNTYSRSLVGTNKNAKTDAGAVLEKLKKYPSDKQNEMMMELRRKDPKLYKKVYTAKMEEVLKITKKEEAMRSLGVENHDRALAILKVLKKMDESERSAYIDRLRKLDIVSDNVLKQLREAISGGALE